MIYLKRQLQELGTYRSGAESSIRDVHSGLSHDWGDFLAGFWTAEAHMGIHRHGKGLAPKAHITVRADDRMLLAELRRRASVGRFYESPARKTAPSPTVTWMIRRGDDLMQMVRILDAFRPRGRKAREYAIWRQAAVEFATGRSRAAVRRRLSDLRIQLAGVRAYGST